MLPAGMPPLGMEDKELDLLRMELDRKGAELASCKDDLAEAYAMLAKAGLDWASERQEKAALEQMLEGLTSECAQLKAEREELRSSLAEAQRQCERLREGKAARDSMQVDEGQLADGCRTMEEPGQLVSQGMAKLAQHLDEMTQQQEVLSQQLDKSRSELARELERSRGLEELAGSVLKLLSEAKREAEVEREKGQNAENVATTVLKWAAAERESLLGERDKLAQERRELELAYKLREYNARVKLQEGLNQVLEMVERLDMVEITIRRRLEERGLKALWSEMERAQIQDLFCSLRQPIRRQLLEHFPGAEDDADDESMADVEVKRALTVQEGRRSRLSSSAAARPAEKRLHTKASFSPTAEAGLGAQNISFQFCAPSTRHTATGLTGAAPHSIAGAADLGRAASDSIQGAWKGSPLSTDGPRSGSCDPPGSRGEIPSAWGLGLNEGRGTQTQEQTKGTVEVLSRKLPKKLHLQVDHEHVDPMMLCEPLSCSSTRSDAPSTISNFSCEFPFDSCSEDSFQVRGPCPRVGGKPPQPFPPTGWPAAHPLSTAPHFPPGNRPLAQGPGNKAAFGDLSTLALGHPTLRVRPLRDSGPASSGLKAVGPP